jgi:hypothetical protein
MTSRAYSGTGSGVLFESLRMTESIPANKTRFVSSCRLHVEIGMGPGTFWTPCKCLVKRIWCDNSSVRIGFLDWSGPSENSSRFFESVSRTLQRPKALFWNTETFLSLRIEQLDDPLSLGWDVLFIMIALIHVWLVVRKITRWWVIQNNSFSRCFELPTAREIVLCYGDNAQLENRKDVIINKRTHQPWYGSKGLSNFIKDSLSFLHFSSVELCIGYRRSGDSTQKPIIAAASLYFISSVCHHTMKRF